MSAVGRAKAGIAPPSTILPGARRSPRSAVSGASSTPSTETASAPGSCSAPRCGDRRSSSVIGRGGCSSATALRCHRPSPAVARRTFAQASTEPSLEGARLVVASLVVWVFHGYRAKATSANRPGGQTAPTRPAGSRRRRAGRAGGGTHRAPASGGRGVGRTFGDVADALGSCLPAADAASLTHGGGRHPAGPRARLRRNGSMGRRVDSPRPSGPASA